MCHDKACSSLHHSAKCFLNLYFSTCINGRRCLIKNQHRRQAKHNSRNTKQLFLSLRKRSAILSYICIISLWHSLNKAVCMSCLCCLNHFFLCCVWASHHQIFTYCTAFKPCLLKHHTIIFSQTLSCHIANIMTVNFNCTSICIIKTHKKIYQCSLSASSRTNNCYSLSWLYRQI